MKVKYCRLVDHEHKECIKCIDCEYLKDKKRRPWVYEGGLNSLYFGIDPKEVKVPRNQKRLDDF